MAKSDTIGVFDSGIGGLSVARAIERSFPDKAVTFLSDSEHLPYGTKTIAELKELVRPKIQQLADEGIDIIVIACNTITTNIIGWLRAEFPDITFVGIEPMVKPAAAISESRIIAVCATPMTLKSDRYRWLKETFASGVQVLEPDCSRWATMIQDNQVDREDVENKINQVCEAGADVIVLGCTHFHWIERLVKKVSRGRAIVLQPEPAIVARLRQLL